MENALNKIDVFIILSLLNVYSDIQKQAFQSQCLNFLKSSSCYRYLIGTIYHSMVNLGQHFLGQRQCHLNYDLDVQVRGFNCETLIGRILGSFGRCVTFKLMLCRVLQLSLSQVGPSISFSHQSEQYISQGPLDQAFE